MVVLLNRGPRAWDLHDGVEVNGKLVRRKRLPNGDYDPKEKVVKRRLTPGGSIEALDDEEANHLLGYQREIVDIEKAVPVVTDKIKALTDQVKADQEEIRLLKEKLAKYEEADKEDDEKKKGSGKK